MQGRSLPTFALDDQDCKMNYTLLQVVLRPNSKAMITLEKDPALAVMDQTPEEVSTNKFFFLEWLITIANHTSCLQVICRTWLICIILHKGRVHPQGLQCVICTPMNL